VILIWATPPLGIKWGGDDIDFLFGVMVRKPARVRRREAPNKSLAVAMV
jgi:hypothetical protein